MSVIGRLDSQVEEVIIAPIARRHDERNREREQAGKAPPENAPQKETEEERNEAK